MADTFLGIDLGTTSIKAAVLAGDGAVLARFDDSYPTRRDGPGRAEQDPADWLRLIDGALEEFARQGHRGFRAGGLTSQVNTHVFVDRAGAPVMQAILWQDTRAAAEAAELDARLTEAEKIAYLGAPIPIDASHPLARMLWVQRHLPEVWARTARVVLPKDYALWYLTGEWATDPLSNIGLVGPDGAYVGPILDLVDGAAERMIPIRRVSEVMGRLGDGTPMATGTMDAWVGLVGGGACRDGAFAYLSGTSEVMGAVSQTVTNAPGIIVFAEAEGLRMHAAPTQSGGASQDWACALLGLSHAELASLVSASPRRHPAPLFLPQLAGERAPLWNAGLRGAFLGLDAAMGRADLARAVYEGVALSVRHILEALEPSTGHRPGTILCAGGGFRADAWGQIRADILCKRLERMAVNAPGIVGAVCLAAVAGGHCTSLSEAHAPFAAQDRTWTPDPAMRGYFDDLFGLYKEAIAANEAIGTGLARLAAPAAGR